jgi:acetylglutamate kinase
VLLVVKYGGNAIAEGAADPLLDELAARVAAGDRLVVVHGGGPQIDAELAERGIATERVAGLRRTGAAALETIERVLCASVNKALVRALLRRAVRAVGVSGQDGGLLRARPLPPANGRAFGFVGEIARVEPALVGALLSAGFTPVVAPLALALDGSSALNVNADTAAGALAGALAADAYVVVTNVSRVRVDVADPATELATLDAAEARRLLESGAFDGGMRPKVASLLDALATSARTAFVCGAEPGALEAALAGHGGTRIRL